MNSYETLAAALTDLRTRGYEADFATQSVCLYCGDLDLRLDPEDFHIDEVHRFEDNCNPADNTILYAISSSTGVKGTLVDPYGARSRTNSCELSGNTVTTLQEELDNVKSINQ